MLSADNKVNKMQNRCGRRPLSCFFLVSIALWVGHTSLAAAFVQTAITPGSKQTDFSSANIITSGTSDLFQPRGFGRSCRTNSNTNSNNAKKRQSTELYSFMGSDGGLLGIGTPELVRFNFSMYYRENETLLFYLRTPLWMEHNIEGINVHIHTHAHLLLYSSSFSCTHRIFVVNGFTLVHYRFDWLFCVGTVRLV